ncbi:MAG: metalloregulator ArsR/SmtB family transcription factor [Desulfosalsimonas sp.]|uniref:ArsR/SmtB family transcription factor n=1 Tax=Desulfosalsimonas sp. TaxID=3073848 RepID=UPI00397112F5
MEKTLKQIKALADGNRLRIVMALSTHDELCVCQITELLQVSTPTVSRHMSVLQNAGLVKNRKDARWVHYRLASDFPDALLNWVQTSVKGSRIISDDRKTLETIVANPVDELCRAQKQRQASDKEKEIQTNG